jgi:hypothetical protein
MSVEEARERVATAAFWASMADFCSTMKAVAKREAMEVCDNEGRDLTRADGGVGKLAKNEDKTAWEVTDRAALIAYLDRAYPGTVERRVVTTTETIVPGTVVSRLLADMEAKGCDLLTGEAVPGIEKTTKPGNWVLTAAPPAKQRVFEAMRGMVEQGNLPAPRALRELISGGS